MEHLVVWPSTIDVQWLRFAATADEETCFCLFSAPSPKEVAILNERAGQECARIGEVLTVERSDRS